MFGWLKRQPAHAHRRDDDVVWVSHAARVRGLTRLAQQGPAHGEALALAASTGAILRELLAACSDRQPTILESHQLSPSRLQAAAQGQPVLRLLLAGPLPGGEEVLLRQCKDLPLRLTLSVHHSFEDPLLAALMGAKLRALMEQLGSSEDEPIVHPWVSRAIQNARAKAGR